MLHVYEYTPVGETESGETFALCPEQILTLEGSMTVGVGFAKTVMVLVATQPCASVRITETGPPTHITVESPVNAMLFDHAYEKGVNEDVLIAFMVEHSPGHMTKSVDDKVTDGVFTVIEKVEEPVHPFTSVTEIV